MAAKPTPHGKVNYFILFMTHTYKKEQNTFILTLIRAMPTASAAFATTVITTISGLCYKCCYYCCCCFYYCCCCCCYCWAFPPISGGVTTSCQVALPRVNIFKCRINSVSQNWNCNYLEGSLLPANFHCYVSACISLTYFPQHFHFSLK